ncbi:hypothetical protein B0H14DRAFT_1183383 [Mycena olivaceomarginata]|nr:hypothetical protein B0H14DRAFT_1183383 [Mycena olivaceomarginata]
MPRQRHRSYRNFGPRRSGKNVPGAGSYASCRGIDCISTTAFYPLPTCNDLASSIASHLALEKAPNLSKVIVDHLSYHPSPVLLVLDNFETTWEKNDSRREVEEFLSLLAEVPKLSLMITMRGSERPGKVQWSRPFFRCLSPFDDSAARQTFHDIAGDDHDHSIIQELLKLTGNLPLAVSLMAQVVSCDGGERTLSRWSRESRPALAQSRASRFSQCHPVYGQTLWFFI